MSPVTTVAPPLPSEGGAGARFDELEARILALPCPDDWDGEGAEAITEATARAAIDFLRKARAKIVSLPAPVSVAPSVNGAVSLFWKAKGTRLLAEVSAGSPQIRYQGVDPDGKRTSGAATEEQFLSLLQPLV